MGSLYQARKTANPFNAVTPANPCRPASLLLSCLYGIMRVGAPMRFIIFLWLEEKVGWGSRLLTIHCRIQTLLKMGRGRSPNKICSALGASVWSKNKGRGGAHGPLPWISHCHLHGTTGIPDGKSNRTRHSVWEASERLCKLFKNDETKLIPICTRRACRLSRKTNCLSTLNKYCNWWREIK